MPDFGQFGPFAIVCTLLVVAVVWLVRNNAAKEKKIDDLYEKRMQDAQLNSQNLIEPVKQMTSLTQQIYDAIIRQNNRGS